MDPEFALTLQQDHERLDDMLKAAIAVREHQWKEAVDLLTQFRHEIVNGHVAVEEIVPFEGRAMRHSWKKPPFRQHRSLRRRLDQVI